MAKDINVIWVSGEGKYFWRWDWTTQITLIWFNKFAFTRKGGRGGLQAKTVIASQRVARMRAR
jgi:hypothetical protein